MKHIEISDWQFAWNEADDMEAQERQLFEALSGLAETQGRKLNMSPAGLNELIETALILRLAMGVPSDLEDPLGDTLGAALEQIGIARMAERVRTGDFEDMPVWEGPAPDEQAEEGGH